MGTVGINFGSVTSGAGFNVATTVTAITANLTAVESPWNNQLASLQAQGTALTTIGSDLSSLSSAVSALTDFEGVLSAKLGASSETNVVQLTSASSIASAGTHTVVVSQLAQVSSEYSAAIPASDTLSGGLSLQVGSGEPTLISVSPGSSDTLASYAAAINAADLGVTAAVTSDTTGSRLSLVSKVSGLAGQLAITGGLTDTTTGKALALTTGQNGQDAKLTVDGAAVDSASNTISTAISGVTFQLLAADPNTPVALTIANDNTDIVTAFSTFVSTYNTVVKDLSTQEGNTSAGLAEPLYGQSIISQLQSALSLSLTSGAQSGAIADISELGISVNNDGTLKLNTGTLDSALTSNYSDVVGFLQDSGSFGQNLSSTLLQQGSASPTGAITLQLNAYSTQETTLKNDVTAQNALIATETANLTNELNAANDALQSIPQQLNEVNELYNALTGYSNSSH